MLIQPFERNPNQWLLAVNVHELPDESIRGTLGTSPNPICYSFDVAWTINKTWSDDFDHWVFNSHQQAKAYLQANRQKMLEASVE